VRVVQIGAYDGKTNDRINPLLTANPSWRAYLVEPLPETFARLQETYDDRPNTKLINLAISDADGTAVMHTIVPTSNTPTHIDMTSTIHSGNLDKWNYIGGQVVTTDIQTAKLSSFFESQKLEPQDIDMLFIDAEGCDYSILRQLLADKARLPAFIVAEHDHMTQDEFDEIQTQLMESGYQITNAVHDIFASPKKLRK